MEKTAVKQCEFSIALGGGQFRECTKPRVGEVNIGFRRTEFYGACADHIAKFKKKVVNPS